MLARLPKLRTLPALVLLALLLAPSGAAPIEAAPLDAPPASPVWPAPLLRDGLRDLLRQYYDQEANIASPVRDFAPRTEAEKKPSAKDPDTLWEYGGGAGTACHGALSNSAFINCTGKRLAATFNRVDYVSGTTIFDANRGYYSNDAYARMAAYYALYHAFAHDYDSSIPAGAGFTPANARASKDYHRAMVRAYEAHIREIILRMFRDTRGDASFQTSLTRTAGFLEMIYLPVVEFMEEQQIWSSNRDRRNAFSVINAFGQRIWWEWIWTQTNGPATAGFVNLGSQATYNNSRPPSGILDGTDHFRYEFNNGPEDIPSLRAAALDNPLLGTDGFWFDADYPTPGEWWCFGTYGIAPSDPLSKCLSQAARASQPGSQSAPGPFSPFGQYYGDQALGSPCNGRAYTETGVSCGDTNLGSIAEEWLWTFTGARGGYFVMEGLARKGDPDLPLRALGTNGQTLALGLSPVKTAYAHATDRLGYGAAGFHGGAGFNDDLEWLWSANGVVRAIRTFSAATHDTEAQNGRYSVGELDGGDPARRNGNTWGKPGFGYQEYPGGMENHTPGPSSLYGTAIFNLVLSDKPNDRLNSLSGLAGSQFDAQHRNHPDEFQNWLWLMLGSYHRCPPAGPSQDPADALCINPNSTRRKALFHDPNPLSPNLRFDYLWRSTGPAAETLLNPESITIADSSCGGKSGVPWRRIYNRDSLTDGVALHDEAGFGAYNELLQGLGATMRLIAERYPQNAGDPLFSAERTTLLKPWYDRSHTLVEGILDLYKNAYGYVPDIENSSCMGTNPDPGDPSPAMISWQQGTGASVQATTVRRAMWYSVAGMWYWWYDSDWLDIAPATW